MIKGIGSLFLGIAVIDFLLGNFGGMNLTYFMGPASSFSPLIFGGIGWLFLNMGNENLEEDNPDVPDEFKKKTRKKKK